MPASSSAVEGSRALEGFAEGAAGSRYVRIPVIITAAMRNGTAQQFRNSYTLRCSVVDGATEEERRWRIASADVEQVTAQLLPVDAASSDPSFEAFRARLLEIVRRKDRGALLDALDPGIRVSFGGEGANRMFWTPYVYSAWPESHSPTTS